MKELSLNILDIAKNSVTAGASLVQISVHESNNLLTISIIDNGCGMEAEFLKRVVDPFTTTRTTRKVGMGIPLFKMAAEMAGGSLEIESAVGVGTNVTATFERDNIDRPPLGDLASTVSTLIQGSPDIDFVFSRKKDGAGYELDTREVRLVMEGIALSEPEVIMWIQSYVEENEKEL